jgi:hypothetical protein
MRSDTIATLNKNIMNKGLRILKFTIMGVLFVLIFGYITMSLWNWLIPALFDGKTISFWQALGLLLLAKILFGGFGGRHWGGTGGMHWKHRYYNKLSSMSPEERERFKARMKEKWCATDKDTSAANPRTSID